MADEDASLQPSLMPVGRPLDLVPVQLKEAALDSPSFRAIALHYAHQVEDMERWLRNYIKQTQKFADRFAQIFREFDNFQAFPPPAPDHVSQAVIDHDYTLLAISRYSSSAHEYLRWVFDNVARSRQTLIDPLTRFVDGPDSPLRLFNNARKTFERTQAAFDAELARHLSQAKTKEPSSLREDAFKLHEDRKAYLRASMDYCIHAPNLRTQLDTLLIRVFSDRWKDFRGYREASQANFAKWGSEMERIRGWSNVMQDSEQAFKRELLIARRKLEDSAELKARPSREIEDYAASTVPYLGSGAPSAALQSPVKTAPAPTSPEKQGWLFLKTVPPKPARPYWSRRWVVVKNGVFGWLIQGNASGGVEESEKIGVLLCGVRPAVQEERRFCFELKTKDVSIICQAETQAELMQWIGAFDAAKRKALEEPRAGHHNPPTPGSDPAFAISPPISPDFAAKLTDGHITQTDDSGASLALADKDGSGASASRSSFDVTASRRSTTLDSEGGRDTAARLIQKLDLHRRGTANSQSAQAPQSGIASLLSASHSILPIGPAPTSPKNAEQRRSFTMPVVSSFAPATLANFPAPTNLSRKAVAASGQRSASGNSSLMANLWGSSNWVNLNRLGREENRLAKSETVPATLGQSLDDMAVMDGVNESPKDQKAALAGPSMSQTGLAHRKTISVGTTIELPPSRLHLPEEELQNDYPLTLGSNDTHVLREHDAEFHALFSTVPRSERVILVFTAMWNPNEQQEFPGRIYVTTKKIYFYSNHFGMVMVAEIGLTSIKEITAAPGRESECDYLFLHLTESKPSSFRRVTIKTFLDSLRPLQRRLDFLVQSANSGHHATLEHVFSALSKMSAEDSRNPSNVQGWDDAASSPVDEDHSRVPRGRSKDLKASLRIDGTLYGDFARTGREVQKFKLPPQPVLYKPKDMGDATLIKDFSISAKALFLVMFGDKSAVFQMLYKNRPIDNIKQTPWTRSTANGIHGRTFTCTIGSDQVTDKQTLDVSNDHLCYVVTQTQSPWHLPMYKSFQLITKYVITHSAKSKCRLAIFNKVQWSDESAPTSRLSVSQRLVEKQALREYEADAMDLAAVATDQVHKLGVHSKTNKAAQIFGSIGQGTHTMQISASDLPNTAIHRRRRLVKRRTLMDLYGDEALAQGFRLLAVFFDIVVALAKTVAGVVSGHKILVALLAVSAAYNTWHGYRDGLAWYDERKAGKFMAKLGVKPDHTITRAVYLSDIEELVAPTPPESIQLNGSAVGSSVELDWNSCQGTFREMLLSSELETTTASKAPAKRTEARLQRTRNSLARYRHDLLVALRVINRVEEEAVLAEWEEWVLEEEKKCRKVETMLKARKKSGGSKADKAAAATEGAGDLGEGFAEYCRSCKNEAGRIVAKR